jgi:hypothetical protein
MLACNDPFEGWQPPSQAELQRIAREESEAILAELAQEARMAATATDLYPGWDRFNEKLGVYAAEGETYMGLPPGDEDENAAFDLEYGTLKTPPTALLRNTLTAHRSRLASELGNRLVRRVADR